MCSRKRLTVRKEAHASSHVYSFGNDMLVYFFKYIVLSLSSLICRLKGVTVKSLGRDPPHHLGQTIYSNHNTPCMVQILENKDMQALPGMRTNYPESLLTR